MLKSKAKYIVRADKNIRAKSAARVIFDELREQHNDDGWNAVSQTTKAVWSSQLWGISNAGDYRSVALRKQVDKGRKLVDAWKQYVADGVDAAELSPMASRTALSDISSGRLLISARWMMPTRFARLIHLSATVR